MIWLQRIPIWWRWYYYICPIAWTLYGLVASQFGDLQDELDTGETVQHFIEDYFGFDYDFVGYVAIIISGFAVLFGFIFAYSIRTFNFQNRWSYSGYKTNKSKGVLLMYYICVYFCTFFSVLLRDSNVVHKVYIRVACMQGLIAATSKWNETC